MKEKPPHGPENTYATQDELEAYLRHHYRGHTITVTPVEIPGKRNIFDVEISKSYFGFKRQILAYRVSLNRSEDVS